MRFAALVFGILFASPLAAQTTPAPKEPPPLWDAQIGASFVGTSGNTDTSSAGVDFAAHRRGLVWQIESTASAIRTSSSDVTTAERYLGGVRLKRSLSERVGVSVGERAERDKLSGIDFRSILDGSLSWKLVGATAWTLDGVTGLGWDHESRTLGVDVDDPVAVLQILSRIPFGAAGDTTQRFTAYPDLRNGSAYRQEAEITAQAAMNAHLALKLGYLLRYSNAPVPGFLKTDQTETASVVLRWKATSAAPQ